MAYLQFPVASASNMVVLILQSTAGSTPLFTLAQPTPLANCWHI